MESKYLVNGIICAIIALLAFAGMWWGWRKRADRASRLGFNPQELAGELLAEFTRVYYVSTTEKGAPLQRVALPGLAYRGYAELAVYADGIAVAVDGEQPVTLAPIMGAGPVGYRVGKAVERQGLAGVLWQLGETELESAFRFSSSSEQNRFISLIEAELARNSAANPEREKVTI
ncbi:MAG: hypothetical protein Q4C71_03520 [Microbacteriaceae bacterium]|nr:hypothetical protein [Microbacteriaceae bacterium]